VNNRGQQVRLDEELPGRGLHPQPPGDAADLPRETLLVLSRSDMLDDRVGNRQIEGTIRVRQPRSVAGHRFVPIREALDFGFHGQVQDGDPAGSRTSFQNQG
jgi:hypothetical protein